LRHEVSILKLAQTLNCLILDKDEEIKHSTRRSIKT